MRSKLVCGLFFFFLILSLPMFMGQWSPYSITPLSGQSSSQAIFTYDYYVSAVFGSDSNSGTSISAPFHTIAKLLTNNITGKKIDVLADGSVYHESFDELANGYTGVLVESTGNGPLPVFDSSDPLPPSGWTKTAGRTNVYQCNGLALQTSPAGGTTSQWVRVWDNGNGEVETTSLSSCDSTAGSYMIGPSGTNPPATNSGWTLYVHTIDGTNPGTNGRLYEQTDRNYGFQDGDPTCVTRGIICRRNLYNDGTARFYGSVYNSGFYDGTKHIVASLKLANDTSYNSRWVVDCDIRNCCFAAQGSTMLVMNGNNGKLDDWHIVGCTFTMDAGLAANDTAAAVGVFEDGANGKASSINVDNCKFYNVATPVQSGSFSNVWRVNNCQIHQGVGGIQQNSGDMYVTNCSIDCQDAGIECIGGSNLRVINTQIATTGIGKGEIFFDNPVVNVTVDRSTFNNPSNAFNVAILHGHTKVVTGTTTFTNNECNQNAGWVMINIDMTKPLIAYGNSYNGSSVQWETSTATQYTSLSTWKAASGQDGNGGQISLSATATLPASVTTVIYTGSTASQTITPAPASALKGQSQTLINESSVSVTFGSTSISSGSKLTLYSDGANWK